MHIGGLIGLFTKFAMLGAEWVMWLLVALSVASVAIMFERGYYYRSLSDDLDKLGRTANGLANLPGVRVPLLGGMASTAFPMGRRRTR